MAGGCDLEDRLTVSDRRLVRDLAAQAGVSPEAMFPAIVSAYLRLYRDAPSALAADPLRDLSARAKK